jgi:hypothetical protein
MPPELFGNCAAFVDGDPGAAGFSEPHPSEHFRWIDDRAVCFCPRPGDGSLAEPCLVVRAIGFEGGRPSYLSVSVDRRHVGTQLIPGYGCYFFPLRDGLPRSAGDALEVVLAAPGSRERRDVPAGIGVYDVQIVDLARDDFPERQTFFEQAKVFQPEGGHLGRILASCRFRPDARILDIGAGLG